MDIFPQFSSHIFQLKINKNTDELKNEESYVTYKRDNMDFNVLKKHPEISKDFLDIFNDISKNYFNYTNNYRITTSWITKINPDEHADWHNHKNSFYSGIYYYGEYDDLSGKLLFANPLLDVMDFSLHSPKPSMSNCKSFELKPEKNKLIFFPSYLRHKIKIHKGDTVRYSLAFNIIPIGDVGYYDSFVDGR